MPNLSDFIFNPFWTGVQGTMDFWTLMIGTRESKVVTAAKYIPLAGAVYGVDQNKDYGKIAQSIIDRQKIEQPGAREFWGDNVLLNTDVKVPALPDVGSWVKWIGIGAVALVGIWAYSKLKK